MRVLVEEGSGKKRLLSLLEEIDSLTSLDSIRTGNDKILVNIHKSGWYVELDAETEKKAPTFYGTKFTDLCTAISEMEDVQTVDSIVDVLVLINTKTAKTYDGLYQTHWGRLNPQTPYTLREDKIELDTIDFNMSKEDLIRCAESEIALYDEINEIVYFIREAAFNSMSALLDTAKPFKSKRNFQIAPAILLAEGISKKPVRVICRGTERFRSVFGFIADDNFALYSQKKFIQNCLNIITEKAEFNTALDKWQVFEDFTCVHVKMNNGRGYSYEFRLATGDAPGIGMSVEIYFVIGKGKILLRRNGSRRSKNDCDIEESMFEGIFEDIKDVERYIELFETTPITLSKNDIKGYWDKILDIIGKKRFQTIPFNLEQESSMELLRHVTNIILVKGLNSYQVERIEKANKLLFAKILELTKKEGEQYGNMAK